MSIDFLNFYVELKRTDLDSTVLSDIVFRYPSLHPRLSPFPDGVFVVGVVRTQCVGGR